MISLKRNFRIAASGFMACLMMLAPSVSFAQDEVKKFSPVECIKLGIACEKRVSTDTFTDIIRDVANVFLSLVAVIAAIAVIYGGVLYITSAGEEDRAKKAKNVLLYAVIGLIIVGLSAAIVNFTISSFN